MSIELGHVEVLGADAVGQAGQRRFCLFTRSRSGSALMWMEKEQLNRLSLTLDQALAQLTEGQVLRTEAQAGSRPAPTSLPANFPRTPEYDFRAAQMGLTYDERNRMFAFTVAPVEILMDKEQEEPQALVHEEDAVSFLFTQKQAQALSSTITILVSGGRPVCPLCHTPLDGGPHACVKQNGHHEIVQIVAEEDEEE
ncbi:MAG: hypothetical protein NVSMB33_14730 [Ktedonobacteraceae bacterium]